MSADVLRAAAALMRNRAQAADSGPWKWAEQTHGEWYGIQSEFAALGNAFDPGNAFHIASWHPAVALAVADWLDAEAAAHSAEVFDEWEGADHCCRMAPALAVARAYLQEQP